VGGGGGNRVARFLGAVITAERGEELEELSAPGSLPAFSAASSNF
jgi:hypothetical protein